LCIEFSIDVTPPTTRENLSVRCKRISVFDRQIGRAGIGGIPSVWCPKIVFAVRDIISQSGTIVIPVRPEECCIAASEKLKDKSEKLLVHIFFTVHF
jgi:hypothetical protein